MRVVVARVVPGQAAKVVEKRRGDFQSVAVDSNLVLPTFQHALVKRAEDYWCVAHDETLEIKTTFSNKFWSASGAQHLQHALSAASRTQRLPALAARQTEQKEQKEQKPSQTSFLHARRTQVRPRREGGRGRNFENQSNVSPQPGQA